MQLTVPNLQPGERSLPSQLLTNDHSGRGRLALASRSASGGIHGLNGFGQVCISYDDQGNCIAYDTSGSSGGALPQDLTLPQDLSTLPNYSPLTNVDTLNPSGAIDWTNTAIPVQGNTMAGGPAYTALTNAGVAPNAAIQLMNTPGVLSVAAPNASLTPAQGQQIANLVNSSGQTLAKILTISQGGSSVTLPNGMQMLYGTNPTGVLAAGAYGAGAGLGAGLVSPYGINSNMLILAAVGVGIFMLLGSRK